MKKILFVSIAVLTMVSCSDKAPKEMQHPGIAQPQPEMEQPGRPEMGQPGSQEAGPDQKAPNREEQMEQIRMQKIAYMTDELKLTVEESQNFWPVYNQWWDESMRLNHDQFSAMKKISRAEDVTIADLETLASFYERQAALMRKWGAEFAKVIPEDKVAKVFVTEERFKNYLIRKGPKWGSPKPQ